MSCVLDREASTGEGGRLPAGTTSVVKACDSDMWLPVGGDPERSGASPVSCHIAPPTTGGRGVVPDTGSSVIGAKSCN
jgi:hypothetical protein